MASQRTAEIIKSLSLDMQNKFVDGMSYIQTLTAMFQQYKSIIDDLVQTKGRYVELVQRYTGVQDKRPSPSSLPGVMSGTPHYALPNMKADTAEIQKLATVIAELEAQKDLVYSQLRKLLEAVIGSTSNLIDTASQIDVFLSNQINDTNAGGLYGNPGVNQKASTVL